MALEAIDEKEQLKVYKGFLQYIIDGEEPELDNYAKAFWILCRDFMDQSRDKYVGKKREKFQKPTEEEIFGHILAKYPDADQERIQKFSNQFFSFYESNGWKVGKNPMKNWRSALVTWQDTMDKVIFPKLINYQNPAKGSWEARQLEYVKGVQSILNDENL